jgi:hypothetical protein
MPNPVGGRPSGVVCQYLKDGGVNDKEGKTYCGAPGCKHHKKNGTFQSSKWAEHVVLNCLFHNDEAKAKVAAAHQTKKIVSNYVPPTPAWLKPQQVTFIEPYTVRLFSLGADDRGRAGGGAAQVRPQGPGQAEVRRDARRLVRPETS